MASISAPLLATIPNGAALANASAFQCVVSSKTKSDLDVPPMSLGDRDAWVRLKVIVRPFGKVVGGEPVAKDGWYIDGSWYEDTGAAFDPQPRLLTPDEDPTDCDLEAEFCPVGPAQDAWVLAIYEPLPNGTEPTSVAPAAVGFNAFYPISSTQGNRPSEVGNIGLFTSCYCSVYPTIQSPDAIQQALMNLYCT